MSNLNNEQFMSPEDLELESISQRGGTANKPWEDVGLSLKTPLNERYFSSQPDLEKVSAKDDSKDRSRSAFEEADEQRPHQPHKSRLHGNPRYVKGQRKGGRYDKSSALSDTSEAPSIASHVRGVRVPSQASDVDQFLDDLFMPVLDGNLDDGLSDAKSLAASMKGGREEDEKFSISEEVEIKQLERQNSLKRASVLKQGLVDIPEKNETNDLENLDLLVDSIKGGKDTPENQKSQPANNNSSDFTPTHSSMGFQPIPGVISPTPMAGMMSPPPMLMPTPMMAAGGASNPQSLVMQGGQGTLDQPHPAMAFTYVPVPVYNMGGMSLPGMQGMMPPNAGYMPSPMSPSPPKAESPTKSGKLSASPDEGKKRSDQQQQQIVYQQAFLQVQCLLFLIVKD